MRNLDGERPGVHLRIVKRYFVIEVSKVAAPEPFQSAQRLAVGMAHGIERRLVIETCRLHNQGVALPVRGRVTIERGKVDLFRKLAAVSVNLPVEVAGFDRTMVIFGAWTILIGSESRSASGNPKLKPGVQASVRRGRAGFRRFAREFPDGPVLLRV